MQQLGEPMREFAALCLRDFTDYVLLNDRTEAKIAKMEAKLRQMETQSAAAGPSSSMHHPSLPPKPSSNPVSTSTNSRPRRPPTSSFASKREKQSLPSLPLAPPVPVARSPRTNALPAQTNSLTLGRTEPSRRTAPSLAGVRIVKNKKG